jgi:hypothetical protein
MSGRFTRQTSLEAAVRASAICDEKISRMPSRVGGRFAPAFGINIYPDARAATLPTVHFHRKSFLANNLTVH